MELESLVMVETIEKKLGKEEGNINIIGTGEFSLHEGICYS